MRSIILAGKSFLFTALVLLIVRLAFAEEKTPFSGEIIADKINLRSDTTISAPVIAVLEKGTGVEVVAELYEWYKVRLPRNTPSYIKSKLASCINYADNQETLKADNPCVSAKVLNDRVNIRSRPSESASIIGLADKNEVINIVNSEGGWYKIEPIQNSFGWVHKKFVQKAAISLKPVLVKHDQNKIEAPKPEDANNILLKGRIVPYGIVFGRIATHKLVTPDNKIFLLKGNRSSLNALNRQKVKVVGKLISQAKEKYPLVEVKVIEVSD